METSKPTLTDGHLKNLKEDSCISEEIIALAELESTTLERALEAVGMNDTGILFSYYDFDGQVIGYRQRNDNPPIGMDGKKIKYTQARGTSLCCYFIRSDAPRILDATIPLLVTEGEKKLLTVKSLQGFRDQAGVSYPGCWNMKMKGEDELVEIWQTIPFEGRDVVWVPDTDFFCNPTVTSAGLFFVKCLAKAGAKIQLVDLRHDEEMGKVGLDDFIKKCGSAEFEKRVSVPLWTFTSERLAVSGVVAEEDSVRAAINKIIYLNDTSLDFALKKIKGETGLSMKTLREVAKHMRSAWQANFERSDEDDEIRVDSSIRRYEVLSRIGTLLSSQEDLFRYGTSIIKVTKHGKILIDQSTLPAKVLEIGVECAKGSKERKQYELLQEGLAKAFVNNTSFFRDFREIEFFTTHPTYDSKWNRVLPGYNEADKIYFSGEAVEPSRSKKLVHEITKDFLFKNEASRQNFIALLITILLRPRFNGDRPFAGMTGNRPNLGKTLACKVAAFMADGRTPKTITCNPSQEELEKHTAAVIRDQDSVVYDNVKTLRLDSPVIERMITDDPISFRLLGQTKTITRPNTTIVCISMNQAKFSPDLISRCLPVEFYLSDDLDPLDKKFSINSLIDFVATHRQDIFAELCGMVEVWKEKGMPTCDKPFRFREWARYVGGILEANGYTEFLDNLESAASEYDKDSHEVGAMFEDVLGQNVTADRLYEICKSKSLFTQFLDLKRPASALASVLSRYVDKKVPLPDGRIALVGIGPWKGHEKTKTYTAKLIPLSSMAKSNATDGTKIREIGNLTDGNDMNKSATAGLAGSRVGAEAFPHHLQSSQASVHVQEGAKAPTPPCNSEGESSNTAGAESDSTSIPASQNSGNGLEW